MKEPQFTERQIAFLQRRAHVSAHDAGTGATAPHNIDHEGPATVAVPSVETSNAVDPITSLGTEPPITDSAPAPACGSALDSISGIDADSASAKLLSDAITSTEPVSNPGPPDDLATRSASALDEPRGPEPNDATSIGVVVDTGELTINTAGLRTLSPAKVLDRLQTKFANLPQEELARLHALEQENMRLKELVAKLIVDKAATPPMGSAAPDESIHYEDDARWIMGELALPRGSIVARAGELRRMLESASSPFARLLRHPISAGSATLHQISGRFFSPSLREWLSDAVSRSPRKTYRGEILACVVGGLVCGFVVGITSKPLKEPQTSSLSVEREISMDPLKGGDSPSNGADAALPANSEIHVTSGMLDGGWDTSEPWGSWMTGKEARITVGLDGPSRADVALLIEGRTRLLPGKYPATLVVRFNSVELGRWHLPAQAGDVRRSFIVPLAVFNRTTEGQLSFEVLESAPTAAFGLQSVSVRDVRQLTGFRGSLESCTIEKFRGWAVTEDAPVSVGASVNGEPVAAVFSSVERPDLASHGLPTGAGFELRPEKPLPAGSTVEVRFADGHPVQGSPCTP